MANSMSTIDHSNHDNKDWFPPLGDYILSKRCSVCKAEPRTPCNAPRSIARFRKDNESSKAVYGVPISADEVSACSHTPRIDRGIDHRRRDMRRAPRIEDRKLGRTYGTL